MLTLIPLFILTLVQSEDIPSCAWVNDGDYLRAADVCNKGTVPGPPVQVVGTRWDCAVDSNSIEANLYIDPECSGDPAVTFETITDSSLFDCSKPTCSSDTATFKNYYNQNDCTEFAESSILTDLCLTVDDSEWYMSRVFDLEGNIDAETITYSSNDCSIDSVVDCKIWSSESDTYCANTDVLESYTTTTVHDYSICINGPDGGGGGEDSGFPFVMDCNWVYHDNWYRGLDFCTTSRNEGNYYDRITRCDNNETIVNTYYYDSNDGSCSGNVLFVQFRTDDENEFDCSMDQCENNIVTVKSFNNCTDSNSDYSVYNLITNQCFNNSGDSFSYIAKCTEQLQGWRYIYDASDTECASGLGFGYSLNNDNIEEDGSCYEVVDCVKSIPYTTCNYVHYLGTDYDVFGNKLTSPGHCNFKNDDGNLNDQNIFDIWQYICNQDNSLTVKYKNSSTTYTGCDDGVEYSMEEWSSMIGRPNHLFDYQCGGMDCTIIASVHGINGTCNFMPDDDNILSIDSIVFSSDVCYRSDDGYQQISCYDNLGSTKLYNDDDVSCSETPIAISSIQEGECNDGMIWLFDKIGDTDDINSCLTVDPTNSPTTNNPTTAEPTTSEPTASFPDIDSTMSATDETESSQDTIDLANQNKLSYIVGILIILINFSSM